MEPIEFEGKNTEEAIYKACEHFSTSPDKLEIKILSTGSTGIFGLVGGRKAKIQAFFKEQPPEEPLVDLSDLENDLQRERRDRRRPEEPEKSERAAKAQVQPPVPPEEPEEEEELEAVETAEAEEVSEGDELEEIEEEELESDEDDGEETGEVLEPEELSLEAQKALDLARETLERLIALSGIEAQVEGSVTNGRVLLDVRGDASGLLIGKKGKTLDAYQFVLSKIVSKRMDRKVPVVVDSEDYRERRKRSLADMALRLGEKAKKVGRPITVSPMNAHDRRVVHLALQDDKQLRTRSKGEGLLKRIIILPQRALKNRNPKRS